MPNYSEETLFGGFPLFLEKTRLLRLILLTSLSAFAVTGIALFSLYSSQVNGLERGLKSVLVRQGKLVEAGFWPPQESSGPNSKAESLKTIFSTSLSTTPNSSYNGQPIEVVLGRRRGDRLVLVLAEGTAPGVLEQILPFDSNLAGPMRRALQGESGFVKGLDSKNQEVFAAFKPLKNSNLALVVNVNRDAFLAPLTTTSIQWLLLTTLFVVVLGLLLIRFITPLFKGLQKKTQQLELVEEIYRFASEAIVVTDAQNLIIDVNPAFHEITGYTKEEVIGFDPKLTASGRHHDQFYQEMWRQINTQGSWEGEIWDRKKSGEIYPKYLKIKKFLPQPGGRKDLNYLAVFLDISMAKDAEEKLKLLAYYDPLTGLANRTMCLIDLRTRISLASREQRGLAVLFLDIDGFKTVNDSFGHEAGDKILCAVAERLKQMVRSSDLVGRHEGDEFLVLLSNLEQASEAIPVANNFLNAFKQPFTEITDHPVFLNCSIGIGFYPNDSDKAEDLIRFADAAMYSAKKQGKGQFVFYSHQLESQAIKQISEDYRLHRAVENQEFEVFYQPQVHSKTGKVVGVEALVRWNDPELGIISPALFIPLAEETGLIYHIGKFVLFKACEQIASWQAEGIEPLVVSVNCSIKQFETQDLAALVQEALDQFHLEPQWLKIEITESMMAEERYHMIEQLSAIREIGVGVSMDDFGTGYSNLSVLKQLPLTDLKIDRAFIQGIVEDRMIAQVVIDLAQNMQLKVVAEGAEKWVQAVTLDKMGCNIIQGFFYARPLTASMCKDFIQRANQQSLGIIDKLN